MMMRTSSFPHHPIPFNGTNTGDLGDFLRAEDDLDAAINGIGFDGDDIIF